MWGEVNESMAYSKYSNNASVNDEKYLIRWIVVYWLLVKLTLWMLHVQILLAYEWLEWEYKLSFLKKKKN